MYRENPGDILKKKFFVSVCAILAHFAKVVSFLLLSRWITVAYLPRKPIQPIRFINPTSRFQ